MKRNAMERRAIHDQRRVTVGGIDMAAHALDRFDDAPHRPPGQRLVSCEAADERLARDDTRQEADGRAGISRVEAAAGRTKVSDASSHDTDGGLAPAEDLDAEPLQAGERRLAISA